MTILIADDNATNRKLVRASLKAENYDLIEAENGKDALAVLENATGPVVGLIDWEMPGIDGIEVCRQSRLKKNAPPFFLILLTMRDTQQDIVTGLQSGANDYITKPFDYTELRARVNIGVQLVNLQQELIDQANELAKTLAEIKQLSGLLPICSYCKKIRDDQNYWEQVESYVGKHSEARFSHGICPECYDKHIRPQLDQLKAGTAESGNV